MNKPTVTVQIGNSDDGLLQHQWSRFVESVDVRIQADASEVHFHACSDSAKPWQNAAWVFNIRHAHIHALKRFLARKCKNFNQDSITWTQGETEFIDKDSCEDNSTEETQHPSHITRFSDSSLYDAVCIHCGATDITGGGWGKLGLPCPKPNGVEG